MSLTEQDIAKLRIEVGRTRARITSDLRVAYQNLTRAEAGRDVARADLDVTREELGIDGALMDEGRMALAVVEGLRARDVPAFSVQYHPEAAAGPHDAAYLFDRFAELLEGR